MPLPIENQRGQAMVEAVLMSSLILVSIFFLLAIFLNQIFSIAIDDALETYFYCQVQKKDNCKKMLSDDLHSLRLQNIHLTETVRPPHFEINLHAKTSYNYEFSKKRTLEYDRAIGFIW